MVAPAPTPRYRALIQLLRTAEDLWNASRLFFARWDLSPSQFNVLNLLHERPAGLSQSELSRLLIMHRSNVTGLVDRLERRGFVVREDNSSDRRAYRVTLTSSGTQLLATIYPHHVSAANEVWNVLSEADVERLLGQLQQLATEASRISARQAPVAPPQGAIRAGTTRVRVHQKPRRTGVGRSDLVEAPADGLRISDL
jgi:DNA-binding MarR family transcriptional regulator